MALRVTDGLVVFLLMAGLAGCAAHPRSKPADLVVYGRVWTGDSAQPWAEGVAAAGDTVEAVGDSAAIADRVGPATRVLANGTAMVTPGFMDSHVHFLAGGYLLAEVNLRSANSPAEFIAGLKAFASRQPRGEWILGGKWDNERWPGAPLPRREWIDSVTPANPVFLYRSDGHMGLANTAALKAAGVQQGTRDIPGGVIVRDPRTGAPTGILKDEAIRPMERALPVPTQGQRDAALRRALAYASSKGVTAFASLYVALADLGTYLRARAAGTLTARAALYFPIEAWHSVVDSVRRYGRGDDWVWIGGVKGYTDGSLGSRTALFYEPYHDDPTTSGLLRTPEDSLRVWIGGADSAGLQVTMHAIGERANGLILDIYDIVASMQPYHAIDDGRWAEKRVGPEGIKRMYVFRSLLARGAHLAFGSDWTAAPIDPILGIYAAVTRRTLDGKHPGGWLPEQKISVEEALRAYTSGAAYGVFAEGRRGRLAPGYKADIVLLDQDLTRIPPEAIERVSVRTTITGGRVVYQAK